MAAALAEVPVGGTRSSGLICRDRNGLDPQPLELSVGAPRKELMHTRLDRLGAGLVMSAASRHQRLLDHAGLGHAEPLCRLAGQLVHTGILDVEAHRGVLPRNYTFLPRSSRFAGAGSNESGHPSRCRIQPVSLTRSRRPSPASREGRPDLGHQPWVLAQRRAGTPQPTWRSRASRHRRPGLRRNSRTILVCGSSSAGARVPPALDRRLRRHHDRCRGGSAFEGAGEAAHSFSIGSDAVAQKEPDTALTTGSGSLMPSRPAGPQRAKCVLSRVASAAETQ